jgi:hypothetical protein
LLDDRRAAEDDHVTIARGGASLVDGALDPSGHERVGRAALLRHRRFRAVGDDENRPVERRVFAPRLLAEVERAAANHDRSGAAAE